MTRTEALRSSGCSSAGDSRGGAATAAPASSADAAPRITERIVDMGLGEEKRMSQYFRSTRSFSERRILHILIRISHK
jgi:hypothetical protein